MSKSRLRIVVLCEVDPAKNPRPNRVINAFKDSHDVVAIGRNANAIAGVDVLTYDAPQRRTRWQEFMLYINIFLHRFERLIFIPTRMRIAEYLEAREFDIIFCHNLILLPFALKYKKGAKVIMDAREYYPREMEHDRRWRLLFAGFNDWMCRNFLPQADYCYSVSHALAHEYQKNYNIKCDVLMSLPTSKAIQLETHDSSQIRLIHHGLASADRRIEGMIEMMDYLDSRFSLDLMLVETNQIDYFQKLKKMASSRKNIRLIPPVKFEEIVPFTSKYDIGIFLCPPTTFNLKYCLPNKFFEFIQACLAIAIGPSPEMARILKDENLGVISKDFTPKSMAETLNSLTRAQIEEFRQNADRAARIYTAEANSIKLREIVEGVL
ncbi:MAG: glycosyltransferase [Wolinella sp.]